MEIYSGWYGQIEGATYRENSRMVTRRDSNLFSSSGKRTNSKSVWAWLDVTSDMVQLWFRDEFQTALCPGCVLGKAKCWRRTYHGVLVLLAVSSIVALLWILCLLSNKVFFWQKLVRRFLPKFDEVWLHLKVGFATFWRKLTGRDFESRITCGQLQNGLKLQRLWLEQIQPLSGSSCCLAEISVLNPRYVFWHVHLCHGCCKQLSADFRHCLANFPQQFRTELLETYKYWGTQGRPAPKTPI